jgi:hypothetical protein
MLNPIKKLETLVGRAYRDLARRTPVEFRLSTYFHLLRSAVGSSPEMRDGMPRFAMLLTRIHFLDRPGARALR